MQSVNGEQFLVIILFLLIGATAVPVWDFYNHYNHINLTLATTF